MVFSDSLWYSTSKKATRPLLPWKCRMAWDWGCMGNGTTNNAWFQAVNTQVFSHRWIWKHKGPPIHLLGCSFAMYSTVVCLHVIYGYTSSIPLLHHWQNNKFGCVPFVVSWSLLFPWSLNTEYRRRKKQHLSAKVSQWEWKPYEDERHEHVR